MQEVLWSECLTLCVAAVGLALTLAGLLSLPPTHAHRPSVAPKHQQGPRHGPPAKSPLLLPALWPLVRRLRGGLIV
jgi:hypothetical protein